MRTQFRSNSRPAFCRFLHRSGVASLRIIAISSFLFRAAAQAPSPPQPHISASSPSPEITFDQKFFDFGKIQHDQTVVHRYKVSNTGNATLHIKAVHANCGCTSTVIGKMDLEPGESTEIEAAFTPESTFSGAVRKTILVISDAPAHPKSSLRFAADVLPYPSIGKPTP